MAEMLAAELTSNHMVFMDGIAWDVESIRPSESEPHPNDKAMYVVHLVPAYEQGVSARFEHVMEDASYEAHWDITKTPKRMVDSPYLTDWLRIGRDNPWIRQAYDPPFSAKSLRQYDNLRFMANDIDTNNWGVGSGFVYRDVCLIQQVEGPGEMLVILRDKAIDSWTTGPPHIHGDRLVSMVEELL